MGILKTALLIIFIFIGNIFSAFFTWPFSFWHNIAFHFFLQFVQFLDALLLFLFQKELKHSLFEKTNRYISTVPHNFYPQSALRHFYMPVQTQRLELRPFDDNIYAKFLTILPSCLLTVCYRKLTVII